MKALLCLLLVFVSGSALGAQERPAWLTSPAAGCDGPNEICVVGQGSGRQAALADANKQLAQFFQSKIKSTLQHDQQAVQNSDASGAISGDKREVTNKTTAIESEVELKGVEFRQEFTDKDGGSAVLAVIVRAPLAKSWKEEIAKKDEQIGLLTKRSGPGIANQIQKLYDEREQLGSYYQVLTGSFLPAPITLKELAALKAKAAKATISLQLPQEYQGMELVLTKLLDQNGLTVVTPAAHVDYALILKVEREKQFIKVEGFERYNFDFLLELKTNANANAKSLHVWQFTTNQTARSAQQARDRALDELKKYLVKTLEVIDIP